MEKEERICNSLRHQANGVPILVISDEEKAAATELCANVVLELPFTARKLVNRMTPLLPSTSSDFIEAGPIHLDLERLVVDPSIEAQARERLAALRAARDAERVSASLARIEAAAKGDETLMPLFIEAVENDVTLGEICGVLRDVWGEYRPTTMI